jgi:hypothetical protein
MSQLLGLPFLRWLALGGVFKNSEQLGSMYVGALCAHHRK